MDGSKYRELKHCGKVDRDLPKIYFCAHHEDRQAYLEKILQHLSAETECSLWYDGDPLLELDKKRRELDLEQMNLFVIPVTERFLTSDSRAKNEELPFAIEKGIPVLPLVVEKINDEQFAEVFGRLQYLVLNNNDPTAISFKDKLKNYLSSVIVSPELNERIKKAFNGYIFLSYRKKDREHIKPIMKTIHQNEGLRDVAVWYDEFLTPGEDFSENIEKNLNKSNVFMLAVTPSLLEKGNYVMTTEYPYAINNQKPVVAVEMVKTSMEELEKQYEGLPACIPFGGSEVICTQLKSKLVHGREERDKKAELEHKFLMGMAYFSGVDVEIDKTLALDLLEEAADEGYFEAMERLSCFYRDGIGIRNTDARKRQMKYLILCKERYEREGTEKSALRFADALEAMGNLEDSLISFGEFDMTMLGHHPVPDACLFSIALLERINEKYKTPKIKRKLIAAYDSVCDRYTITRRNGMIIDYKLKTIAILEEMANYSYDAEIYKNISDRYHTLGNEVSVLAETALEYHQKALLYYNKAKGKDRSPEALKGYIGIFDSIAITLTNRLCNRIDESKQIVKSIFALSEELISKEPTVHSTLTLCKEYIKYSNCIIDYREDTQLFEAGERLEFCARAEQLMKEVYGGEENKDHLELSLKLLHNTAKAYDDMGDNESAAGFYLKYILKLEDIPEGDRGENYGRDKARAYLELSRVMTKLGFSGRAAKCALTAMGSGKLKLQQYIDFLTEYIQKSDSDTLVAFMESGFEHYESLLDGAVKQQNDKASELFSRFISQTGEAYEICLKSGQTNAALKYIQSSISICFRLIEMENTRQNQRHLLYALAKLSDLYIRFENKTAAEEALLECAIVGCSIGDDELLIDGLKLLRNVYSTLARFEEEKGNLEKAEEYYILALKKSFRIYLINNDKNEFNEGADPIIAIYKKQGNKLYVIKKTLALTKQIKQWGNE